MTDSSRDEPGPVPDGASAPRGTVVQLAAASGLRAAGPRRRRGGAEAAAAPGAGGARPAQPSAGHGGGGRSKASGQGGLAFPSLPRDAPATVQARAQARSRAATARRGAAFWSDPPVPGALLRFALPPALPRHPQVCFADGGAPPGPAPDPARIRRQALFWPAARHDAVPARAVLLLERGAPRDALSDLIDRARREAASDLVVIAQGRAARIAAAAGFRVAPGCAHVRPEGLELVIAAEGAPALFWAALAGIEALAAPVADPRGGSRLRRSSADAAEALARAGAGAAEPAGPGRPLRAVDAGPWAARLRWRDPWTGRGIDAEAGLDALHALRSGAQANPRRIVTAGLTPWKRRCAAPFLDGPAGPALHRRSPAAAAALAERIGGRVALWGLAAPPAGLRLRAPLLLEDGMLRSVGLGARHTPPAALCVASWGHHFDCGRIGDLERAARAGPLPAAALARAAALRTRIVAAGLSKYNLPEGAARPPETSREKVLVAGQAADDASLARGAPGLRDDAALLRAARARAPEAFLLYRPHPDVAAGLRPGGLRREEALALADAASDGIGLRACLDWADRVECISSGLGFEALLRGLPVSVHGRPFYAGWGLTEELSPSVPHPAPPALLGLTAAARTNGAAALREAPPGAAPFRRGPRLSLDALIAHALVGHMRCIDPRTRLPAPPERLLDALEEERAFAARLSGRMRDAARGLCARLLNRCSRAVRGRGPRR